MGRVGGRTALKCSNNRHVRMKNMDSEDSDEDYVAEVDDVSEELDSFVGDASEEDSCFEEDDNEEEEEEKEEEDEFLEEEEEEEEGDDHDEEEEEEEGEEGEDDDEEEEEEEEEEEWKTVVKPKGPKRSVRSRQKNGIKKTRKKRRKVVYSDSDDDDDEEFTPDEIDSLEEEEEEFSSPKRKTKKRKRTTVRRKSSGRRRRRKTRANASRKSVRKKSKKTVNSRRKSDSGDDEDFTESGPTLRGRGKKKPLRRKKRVKSGSDSEFCSDPSDYEFTISEEEREQIREANDFCRRLAPSLRSSSKRVQEDEVVCEVRKPPARKGKEKADEKKTDVCKPVCGICLTEEGKSTIRGTLNCCNHYFCFACIMEWSKVESRCPLCKQRFISFSKPSRCVKGFGLRDSTIQIPERYQVYINLLKRNLETFSIHTKMLFVQSAIIYKNLSFTEIVILRGLIEFREKYGKDSMCNVDGFLDFIKSSLYVVGE